MGAFNVEMPSLVVPTGAQVSNILNSGMYEDAESLTLYAPAALDVTTYTFEGNPDRAAVAGSPGWVTIQIGDPVADAEPPDAGKGRTFYELPAYQAIRIRQTINAAADRIFKVSKNVYV